MSSRKTLITKGTESTARADQDALRGTRPSGAAGPSYMGKWRETAPIESKHQNTDRTNYDGFTQVTHSKNKYQGYAYSGRSQAGPASRHDVYNPRGGQLLMPDISKLEISRGKRAPGTVLDKKYYRPGMIFLTTQHEPMIEDMPLDSRYTTESQHGSICSKMRPMIVVALFERHCIAVPLFTHNGKGIEGKNAKEYVSVRDNRLNGSFKALSEYKPLLTERMNEGSSTINPLSVAQLTYPVCVRYGFRIIHQGHLTDDSLLDLIMLYNAVIPKRTKR
ncbi:MAG: hypothetical protein M1835_000262 [Candelina submexicana]|nr:MAG: hypothetical protein M1835_000262 [Candelina submexicana]